MWRKQRRWSDLRRVRGVTVSRQTIRNRVHVVGLSARRPQVVLPLKARHRRARLAWCTQRRRWNINQWSHVMFSDESRFTLDFLDRRRRVWRHAGERYTDPARVAHDRYGGGLLWCGVGSPWPAERTNMCVKVELLGCTTGTMCRLLKLFRLLDVTPVDSSSRMITQGHIAQELSRITFSDGIFVLCRGLRWVRTCHQSNTFGTFSGNVFEDVFLNRGPWVSLVRRCKMNAEGSLRSPYVDLLGACVVAALLVMTIEAGQHVIYDVWNMTLTLWRLPDVCLDNRENGEMN